MLFSSLDTTHYFCCRSSFEKSENESYLLSHPRHWTSEYLTLGAVSRTPLIAFQFSLSSSNFVNQIVQVRGLKGATRIRSSIFKFSIFEWLFAKSYILGLHNNAHIMWDGILYNENFFEMIKFETIEERFTERKEMRWIVPLLTLIDLARELMSTLKWSCLNPDSSQRWTWIWLLQLATLETS